MSGVFVAPYDERNEADFQAITKRLEEALTVLEEDSSIRATQESLAKLANCSRGTLSNRIFPLERLKEIKKQRAEKREKLKLPRVSLAHQIDVETHISDKESLRREIERSDREKAILLNKCFSLEAQLKAELRLREHFQAINKPLEERNEELEKALLDAGLPLPRQKEETSFG
jgi:DNA-binding Lrp family transcriptional regulator